MQAFNCLVTGGTSGVGRGIAWALARAGGHVTIVSRDAARGAEVARAIQKETASGSVDSIAADLSVLSSVRALAERVRARYPALHVLSLNAATLVMKRTLTLDGVESIFASNYLGHFYLANLLTEALKAGAPSRVLTVVGQARMVSSARPAFDDPASTRGFSPLGATIRAAVAKTLFTLELARRLEGTGVTANAFHPGLVRSGLPSHLPWFLGAPVRLASVFFAETSETGIYLALSPDVQRITGKFFERRRVVPFVPPYDVVAAGRELWDLSARLCGIS
ncbi:MAG TPA: SDR family NAD(P)-dependent oxidoreductase [Spirochaetia bacterium]|nr:SDR family NAD(P)-dependent oxidoreductase [Spirochaetia bacterium]